MNYRIMHDSAPLLRLPNVKMLCNPAIGDCRVAMERKEPRSLQSRFPALHPGHSPFVALTLAPAPLSWDCLQLRTMRLAG